MEHLSKAVSNLFLFTTLLPRMLLTSVAPQIKLYRSDVVWVLVRILNIFTPQILLNFECFLKLILENQKVPQMAIFTKAKKWLQQSKIQTWI